MSKQKLIEYLKERVDYWEGRYYEAKAELAQSERFALRGSGWLTKATVNEIDAAVAAEREACAKVAEQHQRTQKDFSVAVHIAAAIRARGT